MTRPDREWNERAFQYYQRLARVRSYVEKHFSEDITLESAATVAAMEPNSFARFFREKVGITFAAWLRHYRVVMAKDLIAEMGLSITEVAHEVGFGSVRSFGRVFKDVTGMTPSAYLKSEHSDS